MTTAGHHLRAIAEAQWKSTVSHEEKMVNRSKARGTQAESSVVLYFRKRGWPFAERRTLPGAYDKGDLAGVHGIAGAAVLEVKSCKTIDVPGWLREAAAEQTNAGATVSAVISKPRGIGHDRVGEWHAFLTVRQLCDLLAQAGYRGTAVPTDAEDGAA